MFNNISYKEVLDNKLKNFILIDVRSPYEYEEDNIPGSVNMPLFNNEERIEIGKIYKNVSVEKAREKGIEIVSKKLPILYKSIIDLETKYDDLIFYCARGGYRSNSITSFLKSIGHNHVWKLEGGYKSYRQYINNNLTKEIEKIKLVVLYGNTGSGKTRILQALEDKGENVIDLEAYANHRGSTLGGVGLEKQNSQKKFESLIFNKLIKKKGDIFFIEGESRRIGKVIIPEALYKYMLSGIHIQISTDIDRRIEIILNDYVNEYNEDIIEALNHMRKRLGNNKIDLFIKEVENKNFSYVAKELMLNYYDPMYEYKEKDYIKVFQNKETEKTANEIINWAKKENWYT